MRSMAGIHRLKGTTVSPRPRSTIWVRSSNSLESCSETNHRDSRGPSPLDRMRSINRFAAIHSQSVLLKSCNCFTHHAISKVTLRNLQQLGSMPTLLHLLDVFGSSDQIKFAGHK